MRGQQGQQVQLDRMEVHHLMDNHLLMGNRRMAHHTVNRIHMVNDLVNNSANNSRNKINTGTVMDKDLVNDLVLDNDLVLVNNLALDNDLVLVQGLTDLHQTTVKYHHLVKVLLVVGVLAEVVVRPQYADHLV